MATTPRSGNVPRRVRGVEGIHTTADATDKEASSQALSEVVAQQESPSRVCCHVVGCREEIPFPPGKKPKRAVQTCRTHRSAPTVEVNGMPHRFCQHCTRMHSVLEFEGGKRTCRAHLMRRNLRRRNRSRESKQAGVGKAKGGISKRDAGQPLTSSSPPAHARSSPTAVASISSIGRKESYVDDNTAGASLFIASRDTATIGLTSPVDGQSKLVTEGLADYEADLYAPADTDNPSELPPAFIHGGQHFSHTIAVTGEGTQPASRPRPGMRWSSTTNSTSGGPSNETGTTPPSPQGQQVLCSGVFENWARWDDTTFSAPPPATQPSWLVSESDSGLNSGGASAQAGAGSSYLPATTTIVTTSITGTPAMSGDASQYAQTLATDRRGIAATSLATQHGQRQDTRRTQSELWQDFIRSGWSAGFRGSARRHLPTSAAAGPSAAAVDNVTPDRATHQEATPPCDALNHQNYSIHGGSVAGHHLSQQSAAGGINAAVGIREPTWWSPVRRHDGNPSRASSSLPSSIYPPQFTTSQSQMERNSGSSNTQPGYQSLWQFAIEPAGAVVPDGSSLSDIAFEMVQQSGGRPMLPYSLQQRYRDQLNQQGPETLRNQSSSNNSDGLPYNRDRGLHDG